MSCRWWATFLINKRTHLPYHCFAWSNERRRNKGQSWRSRITCRVDHEDVGNRQKSASKMQREKLCRLREQFGRAPPPTQGIFYQSCQSILHQSSIGSPTISFSENIWGLISGCAQSTILGTIFFSKDYILAV